MLLYVQGASDLPRGEEQRRGQHHRQPVRQCHRYQVSHAHVLVYMVYMVRQVHGWAADEFAHILMKNTSIKLTKLHHGLNKMPWINQITYFNSLESMLLYREKRRRKIVSNTPKFENKKIKSIAPIFIGFLHSVPILKKIWVRILNS